MSAQEIVYDDFAAVDMRVGRVIEVEDFPEARKPAWKLTIDFGEEIGVKRSSAQVTNYAREELEGRLRRRRRQLPAAPDRAGALRGARARRVGRRGGRDPARAGRGRAARRAHPLNDRRNPVAVKLHRCPNMWVKLSGHPCWKVQKALDDEGIAYEVVKGPQRRGKRDDLEALSGQRIYPVIEFEDGGVYRAESKEMAATIRAGELYGKD